MTNIQTITKTNHYSKVLAVLAALAVATSSLMTQAARPAQAAFPGTNGKIVYTKAVNGKSEIYKMNPDGSGKKRLTNNSARDSDPVLSPDGKKIAFASDRNGGNYDIYVMNADGTHQKRLTDNGMVADLNPAFSPDGKQIVFENNQNDAGDIYVMNSDGSGTPLRLTTSPYIDR